MNTNNILVEKVVNKWLKKPLKPLTLVDLSNRTKLNEDEIMISLNDLGRNLVKLNKNFGHTITLEPTKRLTEVGVPVAKFVKKTKRTPVPKSEIQLIIDKWCAKPSNKLSGESILIKLQKKYPQANRMTISNFLNRKGTSISKLNNEFFYKKPTKLTTTNNKVVLKPTTQTNSESNKTYTTNIVINDLDMAIKGSLEKNLEMVSLLINTTKVEVESEVTIKIKRLT